MCLPIFLVLIVFENKTIVLENRDQTNFYFDVLLKLFMLFEFCVKHVF